MYKRLIILLLAGLCYMGAAAQDHTFHKMAFEKLPSLNTPRGNHRTVVFDGEVAVFGGHTTGFKPIETAEYYKNGSWHSIPMTWPHDGGAITLLKDGRLFLAGGVGILADEPGLTDDNFNPLADAYLFHTEEPAKTAGVPVWAIVLGAVLVCAVVLLLVIRKKEPAPAEPVVEKAQKLNADLLEEMQHLIEEKNLFLRKDLRVADIASELATNQTYVSVLVNNLTGDNFATMIGGYRIRYAQKLMREHPEMVHADVAEALT